MVQIHFRPQNIPRKHQRMNEEILRNMAVIQERINNACKESNRNPDEVKLLLATKTVPAERIKISLQAGHTLIAETIVKEFKVKYDVLKGVSHTNHFIGHLQTNKIKEVLKYDVSCIQSLDRINLEEKIQKRLDNEDK